MKNVKTILIMLAFWGLSVSGAYATTYIITKNASNFIVTIAGGGYLGSPDVSLQNKIDEIQISANGEPCTIQFGSGGSTLDLGSSPSTLITFDGGTSGNNWGLVSLTGKATASNHNATIKLINHAAVDCKAEITRVVDVAGGMIIIETAGELTISTGGIVTTTAAEDDIFTIVVRSGTLTINGGTVRATGDYSLAIITSNAVINIIDGTVSANAGRAIENYNSTTTVIGGTISATTGTAIENHNGTTTISGGTVSATTGKAVHNNGGAINISGGTIAATGTGNAIVCYDESTVNITGGKVLAQEGYAIYINEGGGSISGGVVFAYGEDPTDIIYNGSYGMLTGNGVIIAWNKAAGTSTYEAGTSNDIFKLPATATAKWTKQSGNGGISYANGTNTGFIPIDGVTVEGETGISDIETEKISIYPNPTSGQLKIENGELRIEKVEIVDVTGKTILMSGETTIDISHLPNGTYFVKIQTESGILVKKVIKE